MGKIDCSEIKSMIHALFHLFQTAIVKMKMNVNVNNTKLLMKSSQSFNQRTVPSTLMFASVIRKLFTMPFHKIGFIFTDTYIATSEMTKTTDVALWYKDKQ